MHENAREKEAHATHEHHRTPPPLGCLLPGFNTSVLSIYSPFPVTAFLCSLPFSPHFNSGRGRAVLGSEKRTERLKTPATQVQALDSTDQVHHFSPKVSVGEERNGDPRYDVRQQR